MHAAGLKVYMTSADRPTSAKRWRAAVDLGYDGIYTNDTARLMQWCSNSV